MTLNRFALATAFIAAATIASTVSAQDRDAKKREAVRREQGGGGAWGNGQKGEARAERHESAPPEARRAAEPRREEPRREEPRRQEPIRAPEARRDEAARQEKRAESNTQAVGRAVPRYDAAPRPEYRSNERPEYRANERPEYRSNGRPDYRSNEAVRAEKYREAARREYHRDWLGRYYYNPSHVYVGPRVYYRPYVFRPSFSISFGIFAGYPVPYTYSYPAPIYVYGYRAPRTAVYVEPGSPLYGGVALEIGPYDADVFVDGSYAGHVEDFDGSRQPLTLVAGTHRIEVQAPGYAPLVFDVTVQPGQVLPYRGDLRPF